MVLLDVEFGELAPFMASLGEERELAMITTATVQRATLVVGERVDGELAGLAGIVSSNLLPCLFVVVRREFQGQGVANALLSKQMDYAAKHRHFLTLSTYASGDYEAALHLYAKYGFREFRARSGKRWLCRSFTGFGRTVCAALPVVLPVLLTAKALLLRSGLVRRRDG